MDRKEQEQIRRDMRGIKGELRWRRPDGSMQFEREGRTEPALYPEEGQNGSIHLSTSGLGSLI